MSSTPAAVRTPATPLPARLVRPLLPLLPTSAAFTLVCTLASIPGRPALKARDHAALAAATRIPFGGAGRRKTAWAWGAGPTVLLVHGWGGRAAQMAPLAQYLAARGFRAVAFDVTAHGSAQGRRTSFRDFIADTAELAAHLGTELHACIGHSAGGLGMMAARERAGLRAARYVCLCAPLAPYVPVESIEQMVAPPPAVLARCVDYYAGQFELPWPELAQGRVYQPRPGERLLLIYDHDDPRVRHGDGERIRARWPDAALLKTHGLGHNGPLWNAAVHEAIADFL